MTAEALSDPTVARAAVAKASWRIIPLLGLGYLVSSIDRFNISFAARQMNADLGFSATVYGLGGGLFFLSYALFEVPSGALVAHVGPRRWIARIMISWGLLAAGMAFVRTPVQFYVMRFLLGMAEAGFFPCALYCIAHWFPFAYRARATSRFYAFGGAASIVMGLVSGWLLELDGLWGVRGWQWLFLVEGLPAVALALVILRLLPDEPACAPWLNAAERHWFKEELDRENARLGTDTHDILSAMRDPRVLQLAIIACLTIGSYVTYQLVQPAQIADATGLDLKHVGYLVSAVGVVGILGMLASGWHCDRLGERVTYLVVSPLLTAAAFLVMALATSPAIYLAAYGAMVLCWPAVTLSVVCVCTEIVPRRMAAVSMGAVNTLAQLGAFVGPTLWGVARDWTGSDQLGRFMLPVGILLAAGVAFNLRRQLQPRREPTVAPAT